MPLVQVGHGVADAYGDLHHLPVRQPRLLLVQEVEEVTVAIDDLLDEVEGALLHAHAQQLDDARVLERAHHLPLAHELRHHLLADPPLHLLHRARHPPLGAVHVREAPAPQQAAQRELREADPAGVDVLHGAARLLRLGRLRRRRRRAGARRAVGRRRLHRRLPLPQLTLLIPQLVAHSCIVLLGPLHLLLPHQQLRIPLLECRHLLRQLLLLLLQHGPLPRERLLLRAQRLLLSLDVVLLGAQLLVLLRQLLRL
mmetsp:Transcript_24941/g.66365  ORF Transcript_24941/g.66365 Transcript_24941/m.66365 type:complete len:255 (+) Transcript_24941:431-1195(+)